LKSKKLTEFQKDALQEMAQIGAGSASNALSRLVGKPVKISQSSLDLVSIKEVSRVITGPTRLVVGVYAPIKGDLSGTQLIIFLKKSALALTDLIQKRKTSAEKISKEDQMVLEKIGNILADSNLSAISELFQITVMHEKSRMISAFGESIIDFILYGIGEDTKTALVLKTHFSVIKAKIEGEFILLLELKSVDQLIKVIEKKTKDWNMDIIKEIGSSQAIILVLPNNTYSKDILKIAKQLSDSYDKILYVSMNKLNNALKKSLEENKVDLKKFCFIDAITKTADPNIKSTPDCVFLDPSSSLTKLSIEIGKILDNRKINVLLFDSLSTLLIHQEEAKVTNFTQFTVNKIQQKNAIALFTVLKEDTEKGLIKNLGMFVDITIPWSP